MEKFTFDMRTRQVETREVREGNKMLFQGRTNIINLDGSVEEGEWTTTGVAENYGDCFDKKSSFFKRLLGLVT